MSEELGTRAEWALRKENTGTTVQRRQAITSRRPHRFGFALECDDSGIPVRMLWPGRVVTHDPRETIEDVP